MVSTIVIAAMMVLGTAHVVGRYFFHSPIKGTLEFTELMMVCVVYLAVAWCTIQGAHMKVDILVSRLSPRVQAIIDSITYLMGLGIVIIILWQNILKALVVQEQGLYTMAYRVPLFPFYWVLVAGFVLLCLVMVTQLIQHLNRAVRR